MIKPINKDKVKIKNLLGIIEDPTLTDLLFEITNFLDSENRFNETFTKTEVNLKTKYRINSNLTKDLKELVSEGYLSMAGKAKYKLIKNLWS